MIPRKRKSEAMTKEEIKAFNKWVNSFPTKLDAVEALGVSRTTLDSLIFRGSGKPETIAVIREKIAESEARA